MVNRTIILFLFFILSETLFGQNIYTVAGNGVPSYAGDGGPAISAQLGPFWVTTDVAGNLYITDVLNSRIRKVDATGIITTIAGNGTPGFSGDGGPAISAQLYHPQGIVLDKAGNLYIADCYNNRIRKVDTMGIITTILGNGVQGYNDSEVNAPTDIAFDAVGDLYFADFDNQVVRKIDTTGKLTTIAGNLKEGYFGDGGPATLAEFSYPIAIAFDVAGNLYISDEQNHCVRKVNTSGIITTVAGNGTFGYSGDGGEATSAEMTDPSGITLDLAGNLYISDVSNNVIRKVDGMGIITTIAGNGIEGFAGDGGPASMAEFVYPAGLTFDACENLYIADFINCRIRKVIFNQTSIVPTFSQIPAICSGSTFAALPTISTNGIKGIWTPTVNNTATTTYTFIPSAGQCASSVTMTVIVNTNCPQVTALTTDETCGNKNGTITATGLNGTAPYKYSINGINFQTSNVFNGLDSGIYVITIEDADSLTNNITAYVGYIAAPTISAVIQTAGCDGNGGGITVNTTGGTGPFQYSINGINYQSSNVFTNDTAGVYIVRIIDSNKCTAVDTVEISKPPIPSVFLGNDTTLCQGQSIQLQAPAGTGYKYDWQDGSTFANYTATITGEYKVTVTNQYNCSATDSIEIQFTPLPVFSLGSGDTSLCTGQTLNLKVSVPNATYLWNTGNTSSFLSISSAGLYWLDVSANGCSKRDSITISYNQPPSVFLGNDTTLCQGQSIQLQAPGGYQYLWQDGTSTEDYTVTTTGDYKVTVTNQYNCSAADSILIQFKPAPVVHLGSDTTLCDGTIKSLNAYNDNATYVWQDGSTGSVYLVQEAGLYFVTADIAGCMASDSVNISYIPAPVFSLGRDTFLCGGTTILLNPALNTVADYLWQDGSKQSSYLVKDTGVYYLTAKNECGSFTDSITVANGLCKLVMPSAFTPNGDGLNDVFRVKYPFAVEEFEFVIYNRWGQKVFETNDMSKGWDGTLNGFAQPSGTYVWVISLTDAENVKQEGEGTVVLVR